MIFLVVVSMPNLLVFEGQNENIMTNTFNFDFYRWEQETPNAAFLRQPFGDTWETWTWAEAGHKARKMANALRDLNLPPRSHIGLVSKNCREWIVADIAIIMAGHVSVPFFATLTGKQIAQVLELGDVAALFVGKTEVWEDMKTGVPDDMPVITFPHYEGNSRIDRGQQWNDIMEKYDPIEKVADLKLDDIWTIIFTSGTTGTPKGVMLDYKTAESAKIPIQTTNPLKVDLNGNNRFFSYLPLNHIAERLVVELGVMAYGGTVSFAESLTTFAKNLSETRPTIFFGVPRIYTKFQQGILSKMPQERLNTLLRIPIISGIIKKKIRVGLGLNDSRVWVSGAAPLPEPTKEWFSKIGIDITNVYGMSENCAICTLLDSKIKNKKGSVGRGHSGVQLKIDEASGEILNKGPYLMRGYYNNPEKTAEVIDANGWLHTGDQGYIDDEGFLFITGRVKDTFKTAKGKYIVPSPIEERFVSNTNIEQLCLVGLGCAQPNLLVNLSEAGAARSREELIASLSDTLKNANTDLPNYQKVSTIIVTKDTWTVDNNLVTPTLKVKRNKVDQRYLNDVLKWEEQSDKVIFE